MIEEDVYMHELYKIRMIKEDFYQITERPAEEAPAVNMYLAIGTEKAMLFDSGFGVIDTLRDIVESLTDKPVICVLGHGHPDHAGAAELFDEVYMNERDEEILPVSLSYERRMGDVFERWDTDPELYAYAKEHIVDPGGEHFSYKNIKDGDVLTIGSEPSDCYRVYAIPGHTKGSVALYNEAENFAFISDAAGKRTALVNVEPQKRVGYINYRDGLHRFLGAIREDTALWSGHMLDPMPHEILRDMKTACDEILDGKTEHDAVSHSPFAKRQSAAGKKMTEHTTGSVILVYDANLL